MKFELTNNKQEKYSEEELLADLRKVALAFGENFSRSIYDENGKFASAIFRNRFGGWGQALIAAGIKPSNFISDEVLFKNIEEVWIKLGRQPNYDDLKAPLSQFSVGIYERRFGTWMKALEKFVEIANRSDEVVIGLKDQEGAYHSIVRERDIPQPFLGAYTVREQPNRSSQRRGTKAIAEPTEQYNQISQDTQSEPPTESGIDELQQEQLFESWKNVSDNYKYYEVPQKTRRFPNDRLRFKVFKRDNFKCVSCGRSPAKDPNVELHVDHVKPWSKGGETVLENLQTLCATCNLGKGNTE